MPGAATRFIGAEKYPAIAKGAPRNEVSSMSSELIGSCLGALFVRGLESDQT